MAPDTTLWLHLLAFAVYTGATVALVVVCLPVVASEPDAERRTRLTAAVLRIYDPLSLAALGVAIMTGAFSLTAYKAALRDRFFDLIGGPLAWKLFLTFLLINVATYMAFGLGHRLVRTVDFGESVDAARLDGIVRRLRGAAIIALLLTAAIAWIAMRLPPGPLPSPIAS